MSEITNKFDIGSLIVREEADIKKIAEKLYKNARKEYKGYA